MTKAYWKFFNVIKLDRREKYMLSLIIIIFSLSFILIPIYYFFDFPEDKSATFILEYEGADPDFGTIDYSGIEYFVDGISYFTDSSGIINYIVNDYEEHIFTLLWNGVLYEIVFNSSITETVMLATKSIEALVLWDELFLEIASSVVENNLFELRYFDGTSWSIIETIDIDETSMLYLSSLVMGKYMLWEVGDITGIEFIINQSTITYTTDILVIPGKTIIDVDYTDSIFGTDCAVDLTMVDWTIFGLSDSIWYDLSIYSGWFIYLDVSNVSNGRIVIYELMDSGYEYKIEIYNVFDIIQAFLPDELTEVSLTAKSVEAEFLWTLDSTPAVGVSIAFYYWDGTEFVYYADYVTNIDGKIIITELLPIGTYMFEGQASFDIIADDVAKIETYSIESLSGKGKLLYFIHLYEQDILMNIFFISLLNLLQGVIERE